VALDALMSVARERTERTAEKEHDRDLPGRALVGRVYRLHHDRGDGRDATGDAVRRLPPAPTRNRRAGVR